jgi:vacuolar protein-sorting-associated protein 4
MTWKKVPANKLREPPLTAEDLFVVMDSVKPSVAREELARYQEWTQQFGLEGA